MKHWVGCTSTVYNGDGVWEDTEPYDVRISSKEVVVSYPGDKGRAVIWRGDNDGSGRFELRAEGMDGFARLYLSRDGDVLEGYYREEGQVGMWQIALDEERLRTVTPEREAADERPTSMLDVEGAAREVLEQYGITGLQLGSYGGVVHHPENPRRSDRLMRVRTIEGSWMSTTDKVLFFCGPNHAVIAVIDPDTPQERRHHWRITGFPVRTDDTGRDAPAFRAPPETASATQFRWPDPGEYHHD
ncbi:hypothetical protein [Noviherbaspirillum malthae]|uniref:hypothetical protein n=1 Tax=Noviherbaspirillum malthae TaxID=1260987 RepID=UPI0018902161|nr:hypothetical protein [Noviherbaspirillum malthae]